MSKNKNFQQDFGIYLQEIYKTKRDVDIILMDPFPMFQLIILPGMNGSFTTYINEMCASFDFDKNVLFVFLDILEKMGICNKDKVINDFGVDLGNPLQIDFSTKPILLTGVVLSCRLGEQTSSLATGELFVPIIIRIVKIAQEPAAVFIST